MLHNGHGRPFGRLELCGCLHLKHVGVLKPEDCLKALKLLLSLVPNTAPRYVPELPVFSECFKEGPTSRSTFSEISSNF